MTSGAAISTRALRRGPSARLRRHAGGAACGTKSGDLPRHAFARFYLLFPEGRLDSRSERGSEPTQQSTRQGMQERQYFETAMLEFRANQEASAMLPADLLEQFGMRRG
jgi:hypothetical protein